MSLLLEKKILKKKKQKTKNSQTNKQKNKWKKLSKSSEFQPVITRDMVKCFSQFYIFVPHVFKIEGIWLINDLKNSGDK